MIFLVPLGSFAFVSFVSLLTNSVPLVLNLWFSGLTGVMSWVLLMESNLSGAMTLLLVEESSSFAILVSWGLGWGFWAGVMIMMKSALAPLHYWLVSVLSSSGGVSLVWGISCHKFPVVGVIMSMGLVVLLSLLFLGFVVGVVLMFVFNSVNSVLILSSSNTLASILILLCLSSFGGVIFFLCYVGTVGFTLIMSSSFLSSSVLLLSFMGLPPFLLFQIKWVVMETLFSLQTELSFVFGGFSALAVIVYVRFVFFVSLELTFMGGSSFFLVLVILSVVLPIC